MKSKLEIIAGICHETNRAWCEALGDHSQQPWDEAPSFLRDSAISGAAFHLGNPDAGPETSHEEWLRYKTAEGWTYGPTKNLEAKTHPCLVPFAELPPKQQVKDKLFKAVVDALRDDRLWENFTIGGSA